MPAVASIISKEEIDSSPQLVIEVIESPIIQKGTQYVINAGGYINSTRNAQDGIVYMGTGKQNEATEKFPIDIVVPAEEIGMGSIHLLIEYKRDKRGYFIKDYGKGTGTFVKIEQPLLLQQGYIISYGDSHMFLQLVTLDKIQLKFLEGPKSDQML